MVKNNKSSICIGELVIDNSMSFGQPTFDRDIVS